MTTVDSKKKRNIPYPPKGAETTKESNEIACAGLYPAPKTVFELRVYEKCVALIRQIQAQYNTPEKLKEFKGFPPLTFMAGELVPSQKQHIGGKLLIKIKVACDNLIRVYFKKIFSPRHFKVYSVFSHIEYDAGLITFQLNNDMIGDLLALEDCFLLSSTDEFIKLKSVHAQQLYRPILSQAAYRTEFSFSLAELFNITAAAASYTKEGGYRLFKQKVLNPGIKMLKKQVESLKYLTYEELKIGRKVVSIKFYLYGDKIKEKKPPTITIHDYQKESNLCYEKHDGGICKPRRCKKCHYCYERGRRTFQTPPEWLFKNIEKTAD